MWHGELVAVVTRESYTLTNPLLELPHDHPDRTFAAMMALYALQVMTGELAGPYSDEDARRWARQRMQIPAEVFERPCIDVVATATALGVPVCELMSS